jgi:hypothetical protein
MTYYSRIFQKKNIPLFYDCRDMTAIMRPRVLTLVVFWVVMACGLVDGYCCVAMYTFFYIFHFIFYWECSQTQKWKTANRLPVWKPLTNEGCCTPWTPKSHVRRCWKNAKTCGRAMGWASPAGKVLAAGQQVAFWTPNERGNRTSSSAMDNCTSPFESS